MKLYSDRPVRLLLVEDSVGDAKLFSTLLLDLATNRFPLEISFASDGEMALDLLLRRNLQQGLDLPDIVILDINLPRKNGFEVLAEMRRQPQLKKIPVFILTTSRAHEDILKSYALDAVSFLTKPCQFVDLEELIRRFVTIELPRALRYSRSSDPNESK